LQATQFGFSLLVWGVFVRTVVVWHIAWTVNSLAHLFGYRNYNTSDNSRNNWFAALVSLGEGWHNNHHAFPYSAVLGLRWWQLDVSALMIRGLERLGLVWDVRTPMNEARKTLAIV
jgi:stearoyl-CoA desaturase (delta-9 desaturase)